MCLLWKRITLSESLMTSVQLWGWLNTLCFTFYCQIPGFIRIITLTFSSATPQWSFLVTETYLCASILHSCIFLLSQPYHVAQYQDPAATNPNKLNFPPLSTILSLRQLEKRLIFWSFSGGGSWGPAGKPAYLAAPGGRLRQVTYRYADGTAVSLIISGEFSLRIHIITVMMCTNGN